MKSTPGAVRRWLQGARHSPVRWILLAAVFALGVVLIGCGYDLIRASADLRSARDDLRTAVDSLSSLRTSTGRHDIESRIDRSVSTLRRAERTVRRSWALDVLRPVPGLRSQRRGLLLLVTDARTATTEGSRLLSNADRLSRDTSLKDGRLPLAALQELEASTGRAVATLRTLDRSSTGLWGPIAGRRRQFNRVIRDMSARLKSASTALGAARTFMGSDRPRRYFIAAENNAEMRDQGMVLSYAVVRFVDGKMQFEQRGPITALTLDHAVPIAVPAGMNTLFGDMGPNQLWQAVNATADFAWSGRTMVAMYKQATGQSVDGVIALDVPGLAAILRVVGPVEVSGISEPIDADNAARILLSDLYAQVPLGDQTARVERLAEVAAAAMARITSGSHDALALGEQLSDAAAGGHLKLWSNDQGEERAFEGLGLGGGPASIDGDRTFHVAVQNVNATKLDYFVKPRVVVKIQLTAGGTAVVRTTVDIVNQAPRNAPRSNQFGSDPVAHSRPGEYVTRTQLWSPARADQLESVAESGMRANQQTVHVLPESTTSVHFETIISEAVKNGRLDLRFVPQPRLEPMDIDVEISAPDWHVSGSQHLDRPWDRTFTVGWELHR